MTYADRIRNMTDAQLASYFTKLQINVLNAVSDKLGVERHYFDGYEIALAETRWTVRLKQEVPATPQKEPLCLSCAHANMSVTDDFADCLCAKSGGYEGGKTECRDYERKQRNDGSTL